MEISIMRDNRRLDAYARAEKKIKDIKSFYINLMCYCIVIPVLIFINLKYTPEYYWFFYSAIGWGCGLTIHGLMAYERLPFLTRDWEERKIKEIMDQEVNISRENNDNE
ncbi:MAG: hypothetical protein BM557_08605 [Flavobacterium sp. MedPE-SWcel]|uniref:2TM domain-containing protein n=1 Tax=uncultured Flavobacterium sp. TaxID=165435 RepID=UPI0009181B95|nr:2TM domain-containing protein [uncultured Flavobacterium sp.]OIQ17264.1 MAG: hypothetical protein BM557_08605 [Flavobacterium sp. MedPE-SWcel]